MYLQEIFDQLAGGEFSQLCIGGNQPGVIDENNAAKVVGHINLGLTALYRRFNLKTGSLLLRMQPDQLKYQLHSRFAVNGDSDAAVRYIIDDAGEPFANDIIKVEKVFDAAGDELVLNDPANPMSVLTPSTLMLQLPEGLVQQDLTVEYRANHPRLVVEDGEIDAEDTWVDLPDTHLAALLYYVASRVNNPIGMSNEFHAGNSYFAKYEGECQELEAKGLQVDLGQSSDRLRRNGWV